MPNYSPLEKIESTRKYLLNIIRGMNNRLKTIELSPGGVTTDSTITDGSTNPVQSNAVFDALALKAPLASPTFTGTPTSTTAAVDTNTIQIATTAYVVAQGYAKLASPTFSGTPSLPTGTTGTTQSFGTSNTTLATTAFVQSSLPIVTTMAAASAAINTTETVLLQQAIAANTTVAGSTFKVTIFGTCTSTIANASNIRVRIGTAGTTADTVAAVVTPTSNTSGTNNPFFTEFIVTIRTTGSSGTMAGHGALLNNGNTGISAAGTGNVISAITTGAINTTVANTLSVTYVSAATTTTSTFQLVSIEQIK